MYIMFLFCYDFSFIIFLSLPFLIFLIVSFGWAIFIYCICLQFADWYSEKWCSETVWQHWEIWYCSFCLKFNLKKIVFFSFFFSYDFMLVDLKCAIKIYYVSHLIGLGGSWPHNQSLLVQMESCFFVFVWLFWRTH